VRTTAHLADQALLLHLASELAQCLLELLRILDYYLQVSITPFVRSESPKAQTTLGLDNRCQA
jgi:hypothetical protein